ncbi:type IV secretory system conjugative DNA transfer family protein [Patescibacteria group bacterium]
MEKIVLEIKVPKESEETPEAAAALFASLSNLSSSLLEKILGREQCLTFEISLFDQTVRFFAVVDVNFEPYFVSQLAAQYPKAIVTRVKDYMQNWDFKKSSFGQLTLSKAYYYPLKTYRDFHDVDPLSSLLGTLAKAGPDDKAIIQVSVVPAADGYATSARKIIDKGVPTPDGEHAKAHPQNSLILQKITQKAFKTSIKVLALSQDKSSSSAFLNHVAGSFGNLTSGEGNSLVLKRPKLKQSSFLKSIIKREFKHVPRWQFINIDELATIFHLPNQNLAKIKNISWGGKMTGEPPENLPIALGLEKEEKKEINFFGKTEFKNQIVNFGIKREDRRKHIYIIGKTGTGKSTFIANMVINDMRNREGLAIIDPHGDLCEILLNYIPSYRLNDVCYLDPADTKNPFRINPLEIKEKEHAELVSSGIVAIFHKLYSYSWGPRLEYILRNTILTLVNRPGSTLVDVPKILADDNFRRRVVEKLEDNVLKGFWLNEFNKMSPKLRSEAISPIMNKVGQFVTSPMIREIIGYPHSTIDLEEFMNKGKILICNFSQGKLGEDNAALLGAMFITKMQLAAMNRVKVPEEKRKDYYLYVDEFQNFATNSFIKILSEARKYRLNIGVANQYIGQLPEDLQKAIFGNTGTLISFLVGAQDANMLSREFGKEYEEEDLVKLGNFQIIIKLAIDNLTSTPFYAQTLPLPKCVNKNREKALRLSKEKFTRSVNK